MKTINDHFHIIYEDNTFKVAVLKLNMKQNIRYDLEQREADEVNRSKSIMSKLRNVLERERGRKSSFLMLLTSNQEELSFDLSRRAKYTITVNGES